MPLLRRLCVGVLLAAAGCAARPQVQATPLARDFAVQPWNWGDLPGQRLLSEHYEIFTTSRSSEVLRYLPGFLEAAHANYLRLTGLGDVPARRRMGVYMMASREQWVDLTRSALGPRAELFLAIQAGGYCYDGVCVFWDSGGVGTWSVAAHEGMHQFCSARLRDRLPMWLEEGLATLAEGFQMNGPAVAFTPDRNSGRFGDLRNAIIQGWWVPLPQLLAMDGGDAVQDSRPGKATGYYGQVWALAVLLSGEPELRARRDRLLGDAEAGRLGEAMGLAPQSLAALRRAGRAYNRAVSTRLFRHYVADDLAAFEQQYRAFARRLAKLP